MPADYITYVIGEYESLLLNFCEDIEKIKKVENNTICTITCLECKLCINETFFEILNMMSDYSADQIRDVIKKRVNYLKSIK